MIWQQVVNGLALGGLYGLFAVGYTLVFGVLNILNLAQAAVYMAGALTAQQLVVRGVNVLAAFFAGLAVSGLLGLLLEWSVLRPLRQRRASLLDPRLLTLVGSLAFAAMLESVAFLTVGIEIRRFPENVVGLHVYHIGPVVVDRLQLVVMLLTLGLMVVLHWVVQRTGTGRAIRAVAESTGHARLMGINVSRVIAITVVLSSVMAGAAGILIGVQSNMVYAYMGRHIELKGLAIIVLGGLGSVPGAVLAGLLIGLAEVFAVGYLVAGLQTAVVFGILMMLLLVRPRGLMGLVGAERS